MKEEEEGEEKKRGRKKKKEKEKEETEKKQKTEPEKEKKEKEKKEKERPNILAEAPDGSQCRFRNSGAESLCRSGMKWMKWYKATMRPNTTCRSPTSSVNAATVSTWTPIIIS
jgi:hypothetical protein